MPLRVIVRSDDGPAEGPPMALAFDGARVVIGRSDGCDVRLPDPSVSSRHASLRQHGGSWLLVDEGSMNGTFVGGVRLGAQSPRVVSDGELFRVGRVWLEIRLAGAVQPSTIQDTKDLALALVKRALSSLGERVEARVLCKQGPDEGKELILGPSGGTQVLGRGHGCDLLLDEVDASRRHLQLTRKGELLYVRDLGSKNGTFLGAQRLEIGKDSQWRPGEPLRLGQDVLVYENPAADALTELERAADEKMKDGEVVLPPGGPTDEADEPPPSSSAMPVPTPGVPDVSPVSVRPRAKGSGWGASDVLVVLFAVSVLAISGTGLWFLFR